MERTPPLPMVAIALVSFAAAMGCEKHPSHSPEASTPASPTPGGGAPPAASSPGVGAGGSRLTGEPVKTPCDLKATDFAAANHAQLGQPILVSCPAACPAGSVWGTDVYTDDSLVCRALVHAGVVPVSGGRGVITFARGQLTYIGTSRNGVDSQDYGKWPRSFYVQGVDDQNRVKGAIPELYDDHTALVKCTSGSPFAGAAGDRFTAVCTADCTAGSVWGSNPYTGDSALCTAGHHAGIVRADSLKLSVTLGGPVDSFVGSAANGITTQNYGHYDTSITLCKP